MRAANTTGWPLSLDSQQAITGPSPLAAELTIGSRAAAANFCGSLDLGLCTSRSPSRLAAQTMTGPLADEVAHDCSPRPSNCSRPPVLEAEKTSPFLRQTVTSEPLGPAASIPPSIVQALSFQLP